MILVRCVGGGAHGVVLSDSLAQAQVTQVGPQAVVLPPPQELGLALPLRLQAQRDPQVGLDTTPLERREGS